MYGRKENEKKKKKKTRLHKRVVQNLGKPSIERHQRWRQLSVEII